MCHSIELTVSHIGARRRRLVSTASSPSRSSWLPPSSFVADESQPTSFSSLKSSCRPIPCTRKRRWLSVGAPPTRGGGDAAFVGESAGGGGGAATAAAAAPLVSPPRTASRRSVPPPASGALGADAKRSSASAAADGAGADGADHGSLVVAGRVGDAKSSSASAVAADGCGGGDAPSTAELLPSFAQRGERRVRPLTKELSDRLLDREPLELELRRAGHLREGFAAARRGAAVVAAAAATLGRRLSHPTSHLLQKS